MPSLMLRMMAAIGGKKMTALFTGLLTIGLTAVGLDNPELQELIITGTIGLVGIFMGSQGLADGMSRGKTSSADLVAEILKIPGKKNQNGAARLGSLLFITLMAFVILSINSCGKGDAINALRGGVAGLSSLWETTLNPALTEKCAAPDAPAMCSDYATKTAPAVTEAIDILFPSLITLADLLFPEGTPERTALTIPATIRESVRTAMTTERVPPSAIGRPLLVTHNEFSAGGEVVSGPAMGLPPVLENGPRGTPPAEIKIAENLAPFTEAHTGE